jgi:acyl-CoA thioesterase-1
MIVRRHRAALVACLLACVAACNRTGSEVRPEQRPPAPALVPSTADERPKIVALGDSLTAGYGLTEIESFPSLIQRRLDEAGYQFEVVNAGVSGDTSAGGLRRLDWILKEDVRVLIVALGANDGLRGLSVAQMKENLGRIIERVQAEGAVVILAGMEAPPNYGPEYAAAFRAAFPEVARQYRVTFIPFLLQGVAGETALNQADGIHPNAEGTQIVAETVWRVLNPILDQISSS